MNKLKPIIKKFIELSDDEYILSSEDDMIIDLIKSAKTRKEDGFSLILKAHQSNGFDDDIPIERLKVFNPFGDFEKRGYLRNNWCLKDLKSIKKMEQAVFYLNFNKASEYIRKIKKIDKTHLYQVHQILFSDLYPWAGKSRYMLAASDVEGKHHMEVRKGHVQFLTPYLIDSRLEFLMSKVQENKGNKDYMKKYGGTILGDLALIHPFLDGNGRTILVLFNELMRRNGLQVDWTGMDRPSYIGALTKEIDDSNLNVMNNYLSQFIS